MTQLVDLILIRDEGSRGSLSRSVLPGHAVHAEALAQPQAPSDDQKKRQATLATPVRVSDRTMVDTLKVIATSLAIVSMDRSRDQR